MKIPIPRLPDLEQLVGAMLPAARRPLPIRDRAPDPGLFGPDTVTWRVMREPLLILGGGRALLMQTAHPLVAQGAIDHSTYATDPFGRLERTINWVTQVAFGTTAEAERASAIVNRLHTHVSGSLPGPHATPTLPQGTAYTAVDPELLRWVHASFVDTMLVTHDALVGGLTEDDRTTFTREWDSVGLLMGVPRRLLWRDHAALRRYVDRAVERGIAMPGGGSRLVSQTVLRPPLSPALRPAFDLMAFVTTGLVDPRVRAAYDITWTPAHAAAHRALRTWLRTARPLLPRRFKTSPVYDFALARVRGELEHAA